MNNFLRLEFDHEHYLYEREYEVTIDRIWNNIQRAVREIEEKSSQENAPPQTINYAQYNEDEKI